MPSCRKSVLSEHPSHALFSISDSHFSTNLMKASATWDVPPGIECAASIKYALHFYAIKKIPQISYPISAFNYQILK